MGGGVEGCQKVCLSLFKLGDYHRFVDGGMAFEGRFDFAGFHSDASQLDLAVHAAQEAEIAVFQEYAAVAGAEEAGVGKV